MTTRPSDRVTETVTCPCSKPVKHLAADGKSAFLATYFDLKPRAWRRAWTALSLDDVFEPLGGNIDRATP